MSDENQTPGADDQEDAFTEADELHLLKQRAKMMGVEFSNNIGLETLKERVRAKMENEADGGNGDGDEAIAPLNDPAPAVNAVTGISPVVTKKKTLRQHLIDESMKLVRIRITNLDPKKKDLPGEIFTVANEHLGTVRKFIPYGEVTDGGYHVPHCIYKALKARRFLNIRTYKDRKNNNEIKVEQSWAQEFALDVLPPLTRDELNKLAATQSAQGGVA